MGEVIIGIVIAYLAVTGFLNWCYSDLFKNDEDNTDPLGVWDTEGLPDEAAYVKLFFTVMFLPLILIFLLLREIPKLVFRFTRATFKGIFFWMKYARHRLTGYPMKKSEKVKPSKAGVFR